MSSELVLPQSNRHTLPAGWWRKEALPAFDAMDDLETVEENKRRTAALAKYVKDKEQRFELDAARIVAEVRIGEPLGEGKPGRPTLETSHRWEVSQQDRERFRKLAEHRGFVLNQLEQRVASRKRILARIQRDTGERSPGEGVEIRQGDFRECLTDLEGLVDVILTDPPYPREYLPLYGDLSETAERLLRPGGVCAVMTGQSYLPQVLDLLGRALTYRWTIAYLTPGSGTPIYARRLQSNWKPVLIYEKPPADDSRRIAIDVVRSDGGDTDTTHHHWGQTENGMRSLMLRLTDETDLVVDPFAGGGTTLVAAAATKRRAVGCDIDPAAVAATRDRLAG